ncbi:MAG: putative porin [Paludibacter sp.]|nr:putative porin [Paludibacter sp.]
MKKFSIILFLWVLLCNSVFAEVPDDYRYVKTWRILEFTGVADSIPVDTAHLNFQDINLIDRYSIANSYNGNLGSPIQSKIYFDCPEKSDFIFADSYYPYINRFSTNTFYNTKTPFSSLKYLTGGTQYRKEDQVAFLFTANANKKANFGIDLDYIYAPGEYKNQSSKRFAASFFGTYDGKKYKAAGLITTNSITNLENGGIASSSSITNPPSGLETKNIATNLGTGVQSSYKFFQLYYNQQYSLGFERHIKDSEDSTAMEFVPVTKFAHTIKLEQMRKRYFESSVDTSFYAHTYLPIEETNDTAALQSMTNRFSISLAEEFNKWMQFGLTAYIQNEVQNFLYTTDTVYLHDVKSNTKLGGILAKELGQTFKYRFLGELDFLGYKAGDFLLETRIEGNFKLWNNTIQLLANGFIRSDEPSYFEQYYHSNHFVWENNFSKIYRTHLGGEFAIPTQELWLKVGVENVTRSVYYDSWAMPAQYSGNVQILSADLKKNFHFGKFGLDNNIVAQLTSNDEIIPLPALALYHNFYYDDKWFAKVLSVQLGVNVRYNTAYYAPGYMPATGQFYNQHTMKVGNFPVVNVYANLHLKRTRFYIEYYHLNQKFMKDIYYSMPDYPINPAVVKMGLTWNFYD